MYTSHTTVHMMDSNKVKPLISVETPEEIHTKPPIENAMKKNAAKNIKFKRSIITKPVFLNFGFLFGMDFSYDPGAKPRNAKQVIKFIIRLILWLLTWCFFGALVCKILLCYEKRTKYIKPMQCKDDYLLLNLVTDTLFGAICSFALFTNSSTIARLFYEAFQSSPTDADKLNKEQEKTAAMKARKYTAISIIMVIVSILFPLISIAGIFYLYIMPFATSAKKAKLMEAGYFLSSLSFAMISTYFCMMYTLIGIVVKDRFDMLIRQAPTLKNQEFSKQYHQYRGLVKMVETAFSQILPILYCLRGFTVIIWLMFITWDKSPHFDDILFKSRFPMLLMHLLQIVLLLVQPTKLNNLLSMPITAPATDKHPQPFGVYTSDLYGPEKQPQEEVLSQPGFLTAGGLRISAWFIPLVFLFGVCLLWANYNLNWLLAQINQSLQQVIAAIPKAPKQ